jgi:hypothetical protein
MINIRKSDAIPVCLAQTKDHTCCIEQIQKEFFHKCYLCENNNLTKIETDHFNPDKSLRLDWKNLFYSCGHCNGIKSNKFIGILNPTDFSIIITDVISFNLNPIPKEKPIFIALNNSNSVKLTVDLLTEIHNPNTIIRQLEANNLNDKICAEIIKFTNKILKFYTANSTERKSEIKNQIKDMLHLPAPFLAYKIWIIKSNNERLLDFGDILPVFN